MIENEYFWTPSCLEPAIPDIKYRIMTDAARHWYYVECKHKNAEVWEGGLSGTKEWLGITDEEASRAYLKKK